jgi:PST family polysaccharide transporter
MQQKDQDLLKNTLYLYLLTFSTFFSGFIYIPYLTRVLGPTIFGKIIIAQAYMLYVYLILDFGFTLSATENIAKNRTNIEYISKLITAVSYIKIAISAIMVLIVFSILIIGRFDGQDIVFYMLYLFAYITNSIMPDYLFRGMEKMRAITLRTLFVKGLFTILVFIFIKAKTQYILVPIFLLIGNLASAIIMYMSANHAFGVYFAFVNLSYVKKVFMEALPFFGSRIASTVYQNTTAVLISWKYGVNDLAGYYGAANQLIAIAKQGAGPLSDSVYPYMMVNKNFNLIKKLLMVFVPIIIACASVAFFFSYEICAILFGKEYSDSGQIFRLLLPIAIVILPTYILAFPTLGAMGLMQHANHSNWIGVIVQLIQIAILGIYNSINIYTLCIASSVSEVSVFVYRLSVVLYFTKRLDKSI